MSALSAGDAGLVVRGNPTAEELAALVAVLAALAAAPAPGTAAPPVSRWRQRTARRYPTVRGPGAWRTAPR